MRLDLFGFHLRRAWAHPGSRRITILVALLAMMLAPAMNSSPARARTAAAITLTPGSGQAPFSSPITVQGSQFTNGATVAIAVTGPLSATMMLTTTAGPVLSDLTFTYAFTPTNWSAGQYSIAVTDTGSLTASAVFSTATLTATLTTPQPQATLTLTGYGYPAGATGLTVVVGGDALSPASCGMNVDGSGSLAGSCTLPTPLSKGSHAVTVADASGRTLATTSVIVSPALQAGASAVTSGGSLSFTGYGFAAATPVTISAAGYTLCSGSTDSTGTISIASCIFGASVPGGSQVVSASDGTTSATTRVTVNAGLNVSPTAGACGTQVAITASGFNSSEEVYLSVPGYGTMQFNASSQGELTNAVFTYPCVSTAGYQTLTLTGESSGRQATAVFDLTGNGGTIVLTPSFGAAGSQVTASATGFTSGETVEVLANGLYLTSGIALNGSASVTFTYPSVTSLGNQTVSLEGLSSGHLATGTFDVTGVATSFTVSPTSGPVGTLVTASGYVSASNGAYGPIPIVFGGWQLATAYTNSSSYFSVSFVVPSAASGSTTVTASSSAYGYSASQSFTVTPPQLTLGSAHVVPGTPLVITGSGFAPGETVTVSQPNGSSGTATAASSGNFSTTVTVPAGLPGGVDTIGAVGSLTQVRVLASLTVIAATLTANPLSVSAGSSVALSGNGFAPGEIVSLADSTGGVQTVTADTLGHVAATAAIAPTQAGGVVTYVATGATSKSLASSAVKVIGAPSTVGLGHISGIQAIRFDSIPDHAYGDAPFAISATGGGSGNPVTFHADGNCTAGGQNGSIISLTGAGRCVVTANQAGTGAYDAAGPVTQSFKIARGTPEVVWPNPATISYRTALGAKQLDAGTKVAGSFSYMPGAGTLLPVGMHESLAVAFTPTDSVNYAPVVVMTQITVVQASQRIGLAPIRNSTFGDAPFAVRVVGAMAASTTTFLAQGVCRSGGANGQTITLTGAGNCRVTAFQPGDQHYRSASATATFRIAKAEPTISWPSPAPTSIGTRLGAGQLDARATFKGKALQGTFTYVPSAGATLPVGRVILRVTYTPADSSNYLVVRASTTLTVVST